MSRSHVLQTEQAHHQQAFEVYYALGTKRTYQEAAKQLGLSASALKLMAKSFHWPQRVQQRDAAVARQAADQAMQTAVSDSARKRRIVDMALIKVAKAINADKVKLQVADLDRLLRLQTFLEGGFAPVTVEALTRMPPIEVVALVDQWVEALDSDTLRALIKQLREQAVRNQTQPKPSLGRGLVLGHPRVKNDSTFADPNKISQVQTDPSVTADGRE